MPFKLPNTVTNTTLRDLHRATLVKAREDGAL